MLALRAAAAQGDGPHRDLVHVELFEGQAGAHDVDDRVQGAHLVKGDRVGGHAVHLAFGAGQHREDGEGAAAGPRGQVGGLEQAADLSPASRRRPGLSVAVVVAVAVPVSVPVVVAVPRVMPVVLGRLHLAKGHQPRGRSFGRQQHLEGAGGKGPPDDRGRRQLKGLDRQGLQGCHQGGEGGAQVEQGGHQHVAGESADEIEVQVPPGHGAGPRPAWLMRLATTAAP